MDDLFTDIDTYEVENLKFKLQEYGRIIALAKKEGRGLNEYDREFIDSFHDEFEMFSGYSYDEIVEKRSEIFSF